MFVFFEVAVNVVSGLFVCFVRRRWFNPYCINFVSIVYQSCSNLVPILHQLCTNDYVWSLCELAEC